MRSHRCALPRPPSPVPPPLTRRLPPPWPQVCHQFGVPFLAIKDIANSELAPEVIQLEPTHHIVPDEVRVGHHAALVTAETLRRIAAGHAGKAASSKTTKKRPAQRASRESGRVTRSRA